MMTAEIPGLFDSNSQMAGGHQDGGDGSRSILDELLAEKGSLGPNFIHSNKLLDEEIAVVRSGGQRSSESSYQFHLMDPNGLLSENIFIPTELQKQHNVIGRLLGPKGITFKRIQAECHTKMSILGRGSIKDRQREEEMRNSNEPLYAHLKEELHVHVEAAPPYANLKLAAGVAEIQKMIIPPVPGQPDPILARYLDPHMAPGFSPGGPPHHSGPPPRRGRGGPMGTAGNGSMRGGRGGSRGGTPRGRGGRGRGMYDSPRGGRGIGAAGSVSSPTFESSSYVDSKPSPKKGWQESMSESSRLPSDDYARDSRDVGYNDRSHGWRDEKRSSGDYGRSSDHFYNLPSESEPYYSFSDSSSRPSQYERESLPSRMDYNHSSTSSDWKAPRASRRDTRSHPYSSAGSSYY